MHDKNGHPLAVGDRVTIEATIVQGYAGEEYCNVTVETVEPMYPGTSKTNVTLNSRQVVYVQQDKTITPDQSGPSVTQA